MSAGEDLFPLGSSNQTQQPNFDLVMRGYDRKQVERFVAYVEAELVSLTGQREEQRAQAEALAGKVAQLEAELAEQRRRATSEKPSYRDLGDRVQQIFATLEDEAEQARKRLQDELAARRLEAERAEDERQKALEAELANQTKAAQELVKQAREQAEKLKAEAEKRAERRRAEIESRAEGTRREAETFATSVRDKAQKEAADLVANAKRDAEALVANARKDAEWHKRDTIEQLRELEERRVKIKEEITRLREAVKRFTGNSVNLLFGDEEQQHEGEADATRNQPRPSGQAKVS